MDGCCHCTCYPRDGPGHVGLASSYGKKTTLTTAGKAAEALFGESLATKAGIAELKDQLLPVKWMVGFNLAACVAILLKTLAS